LLNSITSGQSGHYASSTESHGTPWDQADGLLKFDPEIPAVEVQAQSTSAPTSPTRPPVSPRNPETPPATGGLIVVFRDFLACSATLRTGRWRKETSFDSLLAALKGPLFHQKQVDFLLDISE
jgi:hypothetical protein